MRARLAGLFSQFRTFLRQHRLPILVLLAVTLTYLNHFENSFQFDDQHAVLDNPAIRDLRNIPRMFVDAGMSTPLSFNKSYRPLMSVSLTLDYALAGGLKPFYFHLSTFVFYLLQLLAMGALFQALLGSPRQAWLATALYGLHPVEAQTVNYICQRSEVYVALCLCLGVYLHHRGLIWRAQIPFAIGCLAKQNGVVFPALVVMYELLLGGKNFRRVIPSVLVVSVMLTIIYLCRPPSFVAGGAAMPSHLATESYVLLTYFKAAVWPTDLVGDSDLLAFAPSDPRTLMGVLGLAVVAVVAFFSGSIVRFGLCWFFIAQAPTLLVPLSDATNDHRMYGPFIGLALIAGYWARTTRRQVFLLLLLPGLAYMTVQRNEVWHTQKSFWKEVTEKSPGSGRGMMNYGLCYYSEAKYEEALGYLLKAKPLLNTTFSPFYLNLGACYGELNRPKEAEAEFKKAMECDGGSTPMFIYGCWLEREGRIGESMLVLNNAYRLNPGDRRSLDRVREMRVRVGKNAAANRSVSGYMDLAMLLYVDNAFEDSLKASQYAFQLDPKNAAALSNQSACLLALGRFEEAERMAQKALALEPDLNSARINLAKARARQGSQVP